MVQHRVASRSHGALKTHLDQLFTVQVVEQFFRERTRQMKPLRHGYRGWLRQHGNVLQREVTKKSLMYASFRQLFRSWGTHALDFCSAQYAQMSHEGLLLRFRSRTRTTFGRWLPSS